MSRAYQRTTVLLSSLLAHSESLACQGRHACPRVQAPSSIHPSELGSGHSRSQPVTRAGRKHGVSLGCSLPPASCRLAIGNTHRLARWNSPYRVGGDIRPEMGKCQPSELGYDLCCSELARREPQCSMKVPLQGTTIADILRGGEVDSL